MARTKKKPVSAKPALHLRSYDLTPDAIAALQAMSSDASDYTGRKISGGAVIRALLRFARQQGAAWVYTNLCPLMEAEMQQGLRWGDQKR
jgi:hypothetical protein